MLSWRIGVLLCFGSWLGGCQASPDRGNPPPPLQEQSEEVDIEPAVSDSLRLFVALPPVAGLGEPIPISLHIENTTDRTLDLYLRGREIAFDLVVTDEQGRIVWRRLEGEIIPAILRIETLAAGASLSFDDTWDQRTNAGGFAPPGRYHVEGQLLTESEPLVTPPEAIQIERP
jgi:hypothetical protein